MNLFKKGKEIKSLSDAELIEMVGRAKLVMDGHRADNLIEYFHTPPSPGPNPRQADLLEAFLDPNYKVFTFCGGNRLGKTTICTILGISIMIGKYPWKEGFLAGSDLKHLFNHNKPRKVRYVGQDWRLHIETVVIPEIRKWWPKDRPVETKGNGILRDTYWKDVKTGSTLEVVSNGQDVQVMEGWSGDIIINDEPPRREIRIANARGLVDRNGRELFAATLLGEPWLHQEIINGRLEDGRPDPSIYNVHGTIYDNVGFGITIEGIDELKKKLTPEEIEARIMGVPSYMSGLIYQDFKRKTHLVPRFQIPTDWVIDIGIDVHPREKQAILFIATDPKGYKYVCDEIWGNGDADWIADEIIRAVTRNSYRVSSIIIDPLSKGDSNNPETIFDKVSRKLAAHDLVMQVATKDKNAGVLEVRNHLKGPNNMPSMFFFNDLIRTIFEIEGYMWDKETQKPMDKDDHMMENLYRLMLLNTQYEAMGGGFFEAYGVGGDDGRQSEGTRDQMTGY